MYIKTIKKNTQYYIQEYYTRRIVYNKNKIQEKSIVPTSHYCIYWTAGLLKSYLVIFATQVQRFCSVNTGYLGYLRDERPGHNPHAQNPNCAWITPGFSAFRPADPQHDHLHCPAYEKSTHAVHTPDLFEKFGSALATCC
jgi:hypothetical protein